VADENTTQDPNANTGGNGGTTATDQDQARRFTQAELDAHIEARLKREREAAAAKTAKDKETAEAERKRQQGEFESLATTAQARVKELEAFQTQQESTVDAYDKALTKRIKAETAGWLEEAKAALPKDADALELAEAVERIRPLAEKLVGATTRPQGSVAGPRPVGNESREEKGNRERAALRARGFGSRPLRGE